jgi:hypothetical protein
LIDDRLQAVLAHVDRLQHLTAEPGGVGERAGGTAVEGVVGGLVRDRDDRCTAHLEHHDGVGEGEGVDGVPDGERSGEEGGAHAAGVLDGDVDGGVGLAERLGDDEGGGAAGGGGARGEGLWDAGVVERHGDAADRLLLHRFDPLAVGGGQRSDPRIGAGEPQQGRGFDRGEDARFRFGTHRHERRRFDLGGEGDVLRDERGVLGLLNLEDADDADPLPRDLADDIREDLIAHPPEGARWLGQRVRGDDGEVGQFDQLREPLVPLVELVVAERVGVEPEGVEHQEVGFPFVDAEVERAVQLAAVEHDGVRGARFVDDRHDAREATERHSRAHALERQVECGAIEVRVMVVGVQNPQFEGGLSGVPVPLSGADGEQSEGDEEKRAAKHEDLPRA